MNQLPRISFPNNNRAKVIALSIAALGGGALAAVELTGPDANPAITSAPVPAATIPSVEVQTTPDPAATTVTLPNGNVIVRIP